MKRIAIIGGGASGMAAAIAAAQTDRTAQVTVIEHKQQLGKKILVTGNGRCNLTNRYMMPDCYRGENQNFVETLLTDFGWQDTVRFFETLGLPVKMRGDYVYPRSDQASSVLKVMTRRLKELKVSKILDTHVTDVIHSKKGYVIRAGKKEYLAEKVILACGGKAAAVQGSDGSGYAIAKSLGHRIVPVVPALVQLKVKDHPLAKASGVRTDARVSVCVDGCLQAEDQGELQITAYGISGIPVFQISRYAALGLYQKKPVQVSVNFMPEMSAKELTDFFQKRTVYLKNQNAEEFLLGCFPEKLICPILWQAAIRRDTSVSRLTHHELSRLVSVCQRMVLTISDTNGFDSAQVCAGGVATEEINPGTMESFLHSGLYIAGELLDVDGICGGYNLQMAFASGITAGRNAAFS